MHLHISKLSLSYLVQLLILVPIALFGQTTSTGNITDSLQVITPSAIPVINVVEKISTTTNELKIIERKIELTNDYKAIDSLFPIFQLKIQNQKLGASQFIKANPNRQKIDNLILKWSNNKSYLNEWLSTINVYKERNLRLVESVGFNEKTWALTYDNAKNKQVPDEILTSIHAVWNRTKVIQSDILNENNEFLRLESKINLQIAVIDNVRDELANLKNSEIYGLFYLRHLPLWSTSFIKTEKQQEGDKTESINNNIKSSLVFFKTNPSQFNLYFITVLIIVFVILFFKRGFVKYEYPVEDKNLKIAKQVILTRTVASIIFLSLLATDFFFIAVPELLDNIISIIALLAAAQVIKPSISGRFKTLAYFVVFFFVLDAAKTFIWFSSAWYRVYLLIEAFFVITVIYYFTHPYKQIRQLKLSRLSILLIRLTPVFYVLGIISIVSNILGYTNLTDLTLKICTQSGVITLLFYSILLIIEGLAIGLIHRHFSAKSTIDHAKRLYIEHKLFKTLRVIVFLLWFIFFLGMIDQLRPIIEWLTDVLTEPYKIGSLSFTMGSIISFIFILSCSYFITKFISFVMDDGQGILRFLHLPKGVPAAISLVIRYFIIAFGFVLALSSLGISLSKFNLMAGALGVGIGFGLQTVISNFVSGLILVFERPILPGDTVEVNNLLGTVSRIGIRSSSIRTFDGAEVIVPNNNLIANDLINWTLSDNVKRVEILIGTTYDANPNDVLKILYEIAIDFPDILKDPPPQALFSDFGDSSLNFQLRFWVNYEVGLQVKSDVSVEIYNRFKAANIEIPFPQQDVHIRSLPDQLKLGNSDKDLD